MLEGHRSGETIRDLRRHPDPVEWALLVDKVTRIGVALDDLKTAFNNSQERKCQNCNFAEQVMNGIEDIKKAVEDHEKRMRKLEEFFYKGIAIGAVAMPMFYFLLHKIWP